MANSCYLSLALEAVHPFVSGQVEQSVGVSVISGSQLVLAASQDSPILPHPGDVLELRGEDTVGGDDGLEGEELSLVLPDSQTRNGQISSCRTTVVNNLASCAFIDFDSLTSLKLHPP